MKTVLVTGTLGFIFSNYIRKAQHLMPQYRFVGVDKAVQPYNLDNMFKGGKDFYFADICDSHTMNNIFTTEKPDIVIGGAAETFVDDSITNIQPFLHSNILGTQTILTQCVKHKVEKYVHISTDEVYGQKLSKDDTPWFETDPLQPRNPYSASKACAEHIVIAAHNTHGLQYQITRSCNVFGPRQKDKNLVPHIIKGLIKDEKLTIHGTGQNFRQYIYVDDAIDAFNTILTKGKLNTAYNIGDENFFTNIEMVEFISKLMNTKPWLTFIADRKAHDFGYRVSSNKLAELGWKPKHNVKDAMKETIAYYKNKFGDV